MSMSNNDSVARTVLQNQIAVPGTAWVPLTASGVAGMPLKGRRHIRYQIKSLPGAALCLQYVAKNSDGTFTTPTASGLSHISTIFPGNTTEVEPIGDSIQVFGRMTLKKNASSSINTIRVIVTEFA